MIFMPETLVDSETELKSHIILLAVVGLEVVSIWYLMLVLETLIYLNGI